MYRNEQAGACGAGETSTLALDAIRMALAKTNAIACCDMVASREGGELDFEMRTVASRVMSAASQNDRHDIMAAEEDFADMMAVSLASAGYDPCEPEVEKFVRMANENRCFDTLYGCCGIINSASEGDTIGRAMRAKRAVTAIIGQLETGFSQAYRRAALRYRGKGKSRPKHMAATL